MLVSLIGYGEVGRILAEDLRAAGVPVTAFDIKLHGEAGEPLREHALLHGVTLAEAHAAIDDMLKEFLDMDLGD